MTIGELARRTGVHASAIRYYESLGLLPAAARAGGRRVYPETATRRITFILVAQRLGFSLQEIRRLIGGFAFDRWKPLAERKLAELDELGERIEVMRAALGKALRCECLDVDACGRELEKEAPPRTPLVARSRSRRGRVP